MYFISIFWQMPWNKIEYKVALLKKIYIFIIFLNFCHILSSTAVYEYHSPLIPYANKTTTKKKDS